MNNRQQPGLHEVLSMIRDLGQYDVLREELMRQPISDELDIDLLNELKALMNPIEQMRNCGAHNRRPSGEIRQNYSRTLSLLEQRLDEYLASLA